MVCICVQTCEHLDTCIVEMMLVTKLNERLTNANGKNVRDQIKI
jgi:hypothetical protein